MKKVGLSCLMIIMLCVLLTTKASAAETSGICGMYARWEFEESTGILTISGTGAIFDYDKERPGWEEYGKWYNMQIKQVIIEEGITAVGIRAFNHCSMEMLSLPSTLTHIGEGAFRNCSQLTELTLPENLISIGPNAFTGCTRLAQIEFPDSLESIGYCAFYYLPLEEVKLGSNLKEISRGAFYGCEGLTRVEFTGNAPAFHAQAFEAMNATVIYPADDPTWTQSVCQQYGGVVSWYPSDGLSASGTWANGTPGEKDFVWRIENGTLHISGNGYIMQWSGDEKAPWYPLRGIIEHVVMTGKITNIPAGAFMNCTHLLDVVFPDSPVVIMDSAFENCRNLRSVEIPDTVDSLSTGAFRGCRRLQKIKMPKKITRIGQYVFSGCIALEEMHFTGNRPLNFSEVGTERVLNVFYPAGSTAWNASGIATFKERLPENTVFVSVVISQPQPDPKPTEPPTVPPTEPPTEPPTQPPTEPPTAPPTEPATQPPTEPSPTQGATQPQPTEGKPVDPEQPTPGSADNRIWIVVISAGILMLAGGAAAAWFFVIRKRKDS